MQQTIRASVHGDAMKTVTAFFNATLEDMVREVFQNCRRSEATRIDVTTTPDAIEIRDDGRGLADPDLLLAFGRSHWDGRGHEHPAGMGLYSLATTTAVITSRTTEMAHAWSVRLEPRHYRGEAEATIEDAGPDQPVGTRVHILTGGNVRASVATAGRFLPIPVWVDGKRIPQEPFATHRTTAGTVEDEDLTILVRETALGTQHGHGFVPLAGRTTTERTRINFHGHIVDDKIWMPAVQGIGRAWYPEFDVRNCRDLELVLPARKEVVRNSFLDDLRRRAEQALFHIVARMKPAPALPYTTWKRGSNVLGRAIPRAPVKLRPWTPTTAENWLQKNRQADPDPVTPEPDGLIVRGRMNGAEQVLLEHSATRGGCRQKAVPALYEEEERYEGYADYDALRRVQEVRVTTVDNGHRAQASGHGTPVRDAVVDRIDLEIGTVNHHGAPDETVDAPSDVGFCNLSEGTFAHHVGILLAKDRNLSRHEIANLMMEGYYIEDEGANESDATQREQFRTQIENQLDQLLLTADEALRRRIASALDEHVGRLIGKGNAIRVLYTPFGSCAVERHAAGPDAQDLAI